MKQPELGNMVAELRLQKGLTQERLAEEAGISVRTIQRIEKGESQPELYSLNRLSEILGLDLGRDTVFDVWLGALHLSSVLCILVIPLLIWIYRKGKDPLIEKHGRDVLNFQITVTILLVVTVVFLLASPLLIVMINEGGWIELSEKTMIVVSLVPVAILICIGFLCFFTGIRNTLRVLNNKPYHYPMSIPFLR